VTPSTIRRDLAQLTAAGEIARTYGGAIAISPYSERSLIQRSAEAFEAKRAIAVWAAAQVSAGDTVLLDAGSTVGALAHELRVMRDLVIVTPSLAAIGELANAEGIRVESLGGTLRQLSQGFVGPLAEASLERLTFDKLFLGADSVTAEDGICEAELEQSRLKEMMIRRTREVYVLAHAAKIGQRTFHSWTPMPQNWTLITDDAVTSAQLTPFLARGVRVIVVDSEGRQSAPTDTAN
jgi:DeoR/GlpR family transcriptional regulator of sugar metabolism